MVLGDLFLDQSKNRNGRYAAHNNHFGDAE